MDPWKKPSPALTERKKKRKSYNVSIARGIMYFHLFRVPRKAEGSPRGSRWYCLKPSGRSSWECMLDWNPGAHGPSTHPFRHNSLYVWDFWTSSPCRARAGPETAACCLWDFPACASSELAPLGWGEGEEREWNCLGHCSSHTALHF